MEKRSFLLEIGCEEIPDKQLLIAFESIKTSFACFLQNANLECSDYKISGTPRRLFLSVEDLDEKQADQSVLKTGPSINIAYKPDGTLSPAGLGFLKKIGVTAEQAITLDTEKGSFLAVQFEQAGQDTLSLLSTWIPSMITQIPFGKKMIWHKADFSFSRPLRWLLMLWDGVPQTVDFFGLSSGEVSHGNRYLGLDAALEIKATIGSSVEKYYLKTLREAKVIADADERRSLILDQLAHVFDGTGFSVIEDLRLVDTVCNLVEYPTAVVGEFEARFLALPEKIIISTISQNQKYFSVKDCQGALTNKFVFISNGDPKFSSLITRGNEKVVNARLADALWYYNEDTKQPLESYTARLGDVVFQAKLGTMADKTSRIVKLCGLITQYLNTDAIETEKVMRCATLCKADLVTTMLGEKEFTKLQGYIGKQYAIASGEDLQVASGIYEHYMPRGSADELPETLCGSIVAIADKMDSVAGIIGIGMMPTGSGDPFALRRAANGIVQIISARKWDVDLFALADSALSLVGDQCQTDPIAKQNLHSFMEQRVVALLKQQGIAYDIIESVMHIDKSHINDLENRALALQNLKNHEDFIRLVIGFKRVANIIADTKEFPPLKVSLLLEQAEITLHELLLKLHEQIDTALQYKDYSIALSHLIDYGKAIDDFFDAVLVNCEDAITRINRHALLWDVKQEFLRVADLSQIVTNSEI
ncbi:MAG: glycine--tRNA ligase subunit beta [Candidatus Cloacimonetes bacterium]|nr:glycine--tRNA ligase subunit beta [Candidatus Cloacimonadota bacterium]